MLGQLETNIDFWVNDVRIEMDTNKTLKTKQKNKKPHTSKKSDTKSLTCSMRLNLCNCSSVARAFPGGRVAHPQSQSEEENEKSLRKSRKN